MLIFNSISIFYPDFYHEANSNRSLFKGPDVTPKAVSSDPLIFLGSFRCFNFFHTRIG